MNGAIVNAWASLLRLARFLFWYAVAVAALFYLLPMVGLFLESRYDALSSAAKFFAVIGFFSVVAAWQAVAVRDRWRQALAGKNTA
jgi:positive regulator of sigma E activity